MKSVMIAVLFASLSAFAGPKKGDKVEMSIEYSAGTASRIGTGTIEITDIKLGKAYLLINLNFEGEDRQTMEETQDLADLGYIEDMAALKVICEKNGGELGTAEVDGSTIDICTTVDGENIIKNAVVPFGVYEVYGASEGAKSHLKLLKYSVGP
jgi:hypothetical protein